MKKQNLIYIRTAGKLRCAKIRLMNITIFPFQPKYQTEARNLILAGLAEHWGKNFDPSKNPDLDDIGRSYANAYFLIALQNNKVIGTGALIPKSEEIAEVVRMSVANSARRNGIGRKILRELCRYAKAHNYNQVILETTHTWRDAIQFYQNFGFQIARRQGDDIYFTLNLKK